MISIGRSKKNVSWVTSDMVALPGTTLNNVQKKRQKTAETCPEILEIREPIGKIFFADGITLAALKVVR